MDRYAKLQKAWEAFADTGSVGAYLMYRAMLDFERTDR